MESDRFRDAVPVNGLLARVWEEVEEKSSLHVPETHHKVEQGTID